MKSDTFDNLTRSLGAIPTRRGVLRGLAITLGLGLTTRLPDNADARNKKHRKGKKRKNRNDKPKVKVNEFGCVSVGKACNGKDSKCCSGICDGKKSKKGKKDKSRCVAHNELDCQADQDLCPEGVHFPCGTGQFSTCFRTTGHASFCGNIGKLACFDCAKDSDCEEFIGPGAACVFCVGGGCAETGEKICVLPGK